MLSERTPNPAFERTRRQRAWLSTVVTGRSVLTIPPRQEPTHFKTQRGFDLPIGLELFAEYRGKKLTAKVTARGIEYNGTAYEVSPSAFQAKKDCGASDTTASTNGWKFWMFMKNGRPDFIDALRPPAR